MEEEEENTKAEEAAALRNAAAYLEKFDRYECQELLSHAMSDWQLSTEHFKLPVEPPCGLASEMHVTSDEDNTVFFLIPHRPDISGLDMREVHQIVRELTFGICGLNQAPRICLEGKFDQGTTVQLPPAYHDTRVGQILTNVDYTMKALWLGAYFPKDKRLKFVDKWRMSLDVNAAGKPETKKIHINEFIGAGKYVGPFRERTELLCTSEKFPV